jgi:hypothetical protein
MERPAPHETPAGGVGPGAGQEHGSAGGSGSSRDDGSVTRDRGRREGDEEPSTASGHRHSAGSSANSNDGPCPVSALASPKNITTLNGTDYIRLDLIGRGGSSKVHRVLASSGQVGQ